MYIYIIIINMYNISEHLPFFQSAKLQPGDFADEVQSSIFYKNRTWQGGSSVWATEGKAEMKLMALSFPETSATVYGLGKPQSQRMLPLCIFLSASSQACSAYSTPMARASSPLRSQSESIRQCLWCKRRKRMTTCDKWAFIWCFSACANLIEKLGNISNSCG